MKWPILRYLYLTVECKSSRLEKGPKNSINGKDGMRLMQQAFIFGLMLMVSALACCEDECADLNLPDLLKLTSGEVVDSSCGWLEKRRPELIDLFEREMYGHAPVGRPEGMAFDVVQTRKDAMAGSATLKQVKIAFQGPGGEGSLNLTLFLPNKRSGPAPVFLLICHRDRENIDPERMIRKPFWPAEQLIERRYGAATFHVSDIDPDEDDGFKKWACMVVRSTEKRET